MLIGHNSGTLMHANRYGGNDLDKWYGEGVVPVRVKDLHMYAFHIRDDVMDCERRGHDTRIVVALFNPLPFVDDSR